MQRENERSNQFYKMTGTPVSKLIMSLSVPAMISMLITNIYNLVDTAFVGSLGTSASGAVGIVFGFMSIIQACGFMFGQGSEQGKRAGGNLCLYRSCNINAFWGNYFGYRISDS